jgi:GPH family glycoside/pentoside/hexuronide:cation symporter
MFWKIFSCYLPFFYSNIFGLSLVDAGVLMLVCRIWDAVSDPMMGIIADRTKTRWGKYRPYLLWVAAPFSICGILLFTTPDLAYAGKLIWAYVTYILMMTVYTGINVPYGAMLGVMCDNPEEKTVFSAYRMTFAYAGSFIALFAWEPLCNWFQNSFGTSPSTSWQWAMIVIATGCFVLFVLCFLLTREHLKTVSTSSVGNDFKDLLRNKPWWLLVGAALCFNLANTFRYAGIPYFFSDIIPGSAHIGNILFYSGLFLGVGEIANMLGVVLAVPISKKLGKKSTFILVALAFAGLNLLFWSLPISETGFWMMMGLQIVISIFTGIMSPLVWSMYADVSDYAELKFNTASTGLVFSSASMAQKFGGAFGGAAVMWLLDAAGYITPVDGVAAAAQPSSAISCIWMMMTVYPAAVALITAVFVWLYPLTTKRVNEIVDALNQQRAAKGQL